MKLYDVLTFYKKGESTMEKVELTLEVKEETDSSFLLSDDSMSGEWVPKLLVDHSPDPQVGDVIAFEMPEWLAIEKGFV